LHLRGNVGSAWNQYLCAVGSEILIFTPECESRKPLESVSKRCEEEDTDICTSEGCHGLPRISICTLWKREY